MSRSARRPLSILTYSSLFPNCIQTRHGIFVEERLKHLVRDYPVASRVVAPVPWFPFPARLFGQYGKLAQVPPQENRNGIEVHHPRYAVVPGLSWRFSPPLMYSASIGLVRRLHARSPIDLIDAHFVYPDGVAAVMIGEKLGIPVVMTARGNDISLMPGYRLPRRYIDWATRRAAAVIGVCAALQQALSDLGVDEARLHVLRNGVDLQKFQPVDGKAMRERLGVAAGRMLLSVGHLIERKGNHLTIEALMQLPECTLVLVGDGPEEQNLRRLAHRSGVADRVLFVGAVPQQALNEYYSAADALVLASSREGWANVLLEAMACGTPVVASNVWGTPEVVSDRAAGLLLDERSAPGIVRGCRKLFAGPPSRTETRRFAEGFSWDDTSRGQYDLFSHIVAREQAEPAR